MTILGACTYLVVLWEYLCNIFFLSFQAKHEINVCLDTLACMSQQSSARKSCSQLEIQCVIDISPKFIDTESYFHSNSVAARISQLECKIEALLCQLPARQPRRTSGINNQQEQDENSSNSCRMNLEKCIQDQAKLSSCENTTATLHLNLYPM